MSKKDPPELPGFYFDKIKNRYFKLLPGQEHLDPISRETLSKQKVQQRKENINKPKIQRPSKRKCINISEFIMQQRCFSTKSFEQNVLKSLVGNSFLDNECSSVCIEYPEALCFQRSKPSPDCSKLLLNYQNHQNSFLISVDRLDKRNRVFHFQKTRLCYNQYTNTVLQDFSYASVRYNNSGIVAVTIPNYTGGSFIHMLPDANEYVDVCWKNIREFSSACEWKQERLIYSMNANVMVVRDVERHFAINSTWSAGGVAIKSKVNRENHACSLDYCNSLLFVSHLRGNSFVYDEREKGRSCIAMNELLDGVLSSHIKVLHNGLSLLIRCFATSDCLHMWDIRNPRRPVMLYENSHSKSVKPWKYKKWLNGYTDFFVDPHEEIISSNHQNSLVLQDVKTGTELFQSNKIRGMYSKHWPLFCNDGGILEVGNTLTTKTKWWPLASSKVCC